tara:strand:+ start:565 stop:1239 length:675 start_codon:yes stop_codon:yes gene_type:complete
MKKDDLVKLVDQKQYRLDCNLAKKQSPFTGKSLKGNRGFNSDIPHDISDELWDLEIEESEKLRLFFELYNDMPCYGYLMYLHGEFKRSLSENGKVEVLNRFHEYLSSEFYEFKEPILYSLWCDYFEEIDLADYLWLELLSRGRTTYLLKGLLSVSGPIEWSLKNELINELIADERYHESIYEAIRCAEYDVFGKIEHKQAYEFITKLKVPIDSKFMKLLSSKRF